MSQNVNIPSHFSLSKTHIFALHLKSVPPLGQSVAVRHSEKHQELCIGGIQQPKNVYLGKSKLKLQEPNPKTQSPNGF